MYDEQWQVLLQATRNYLAQRENSSWQPLLAATS